MINSKALRVGLIKFVPERWNLDGNFAVFKKLAIKAGQSGVKLLVTPECFLDGYCVKEAREGTLDRKRFENEAAVTLDSVYLKEASALARACSMNIVFCFSLRVPDGVKNAAAVIDTNGNIVGMYFKTHLLAHDCHYIPGDEFPVFKLNFFKAGIVICADRRWPEPARALRLKGAELIINPTYGVYGERNDRWISTRAFENEVPYLFCHPEDSVVINHKGAIVGRLQSNVPDVFIYDISLNEEIPEEKSLIRHRRPEIYTTKA